MDQPRGYENYSWRIDLYNLQRAGDPHALDRLTDYIEKMDGRCKEAYGAGATAGEYHAHSEWEKIATILASRLAGLDRFHDTTFSNIQWAREELRRSKDANRGQETDDPDGVGSTYF